MHNPEKEKIMGLYFCFALIIAVVCVSGVGSVRVWFHIRGLI